MKASLWASAVASALAAAGPAAAQEVKPEAKPEVRKGDQVTVTASPLGRADVDLAQPASVLDEEALRRKRAASIGDTLAQEPGVQSSAFGPAAGRPIIRGLDGPRIRVLENGIGTMDASAVSPDHAVTTESLNAEQVEILRGPASLLYGSGAIGGVVNVVSNLVPRERRPASGAIEGRLGSANDERAGAFRIDAGSGAAMLHADGFSRRTRDYDTPLGKLAGSDVDARGAGLGGSWVGSKGYVGLGISGLRNDYGIPSGEGTRIALEQSRVEASGELADPMAGLARAKFRAGHSDYEHREIESDGEIGTTFRTKSWEGRLEVLHAPLAGWKGTLGFQGQDREQSALGEEAILPLTRARALAAFLVQERDFGAATIDLGLRVEREDRRPEGDLPRRDFTLATPAAGVVFRLPGELRLAVSATQAGRAPSVEELYTLGAHHATATYEIGDPALRKEVSRNVDVTLRQASGAMRWKVNVFANRVKDYVFTASQDADGDGVADRVDEEGVADPEGEFLVQRYAQAAARFRGLEAEIGWRDPAGAGSWRLFGDLVRGRLDSGENLPRMSPARVGGEVRVRRGPVEAGVSFIHAFEQDRVAPLETATPGYTRLDADLAWTLERGAGGRLVFFLQGTNLTDRVIRVHTSYLKDVAPLMGRSITAGLRGEF
jgi:iron complex outermembrane receptor protein